MIKHSLAAVVRVGVLGILGGSGLYKLPFLQKVVEKSVKTEFGQPSAKPSIGRVDDTSVVFIPRHGAKHEIPANRINHQANMAAMKKEGVTHILASASTGSLKRIIRPGDFVVPDDFIGFWNIPTMRKDVHHATAVLDPELRRTLVQAATKKGLIVRNGGTYLQTTGPRLETRAEIMFFRQYGDILGMTMASEATLAGELGIAYASLCSVDNYCNGIVPQPLTYSHIVLQQKRNLEKLLRALETAVEMLA